MERWEDNIKMDIKRGRMGWGVRVALIREINAYKSLV
jgi:hypothetical protein